MVEAERMVGRSTMTFAILARFRAISKDGTHETSPLSCGVSCRNGRSSLNSQAQPRNEYVGRNSESFHLGYRATGPQLTKKSSLDHILDLSQPHCPAI